MDGNGTGNLALAGSLVNIGQGLKFREKRDPLPLSLRLGSSLEIRRGMLALDAVLPRSAPPIFAFGAEYAAPIGEAVRIAGRAGYNTRTISSGLGAMTGFSFGAGLGIRNFQFDYAMAPFGDLGLTHRVSLGLRWGEAGGTAPAPERETRSRRRSPVRDYAERHFKRADKLIDEGLFVQARTELRAAAALLDDGDVRMVGYLQRLGYIAELQKDVGAAKAAYEKAIRLAERLGDSGPDAADAYAGMGLCLDAEEDFRKALRFYEQALDLGLDADTRKRVEDRAVKIRRKLRR